MAVTLLSRDPGVGVQAEILCLPGVYAGAGHTKRGAGVGWARSSRADRRRLGELATIPESLPERSGFVVESDSQETQEQVVERGGSDGARQDKCTGEMERGTHPCGWDGIVEKDKGSGSGGPWA